MNPVAGWLVCQEWDDAMAHDEGYILYSEDLALKEAKRKTQLTGAPWYVCKVVPTHFIKPPVTLEPEVIDVAVAP